MEFRSYHVHAYLRTTSFRVEGRERDLQENKVRGFHFSRHFVGFAIIEIVDCEYLTKGSFEASNSQGTEAIYVFPRFEYGEAAVVVF